MFAGYSCSRLVLPSLTILSQAAYSAKVASTPFAILTDAEAIEIEAVIARIIPTTKTPGAKEAGVVHFFDQTFGTFNAPMLGAVRSGMERFQAEIEGGALFSALSESAQDSYLEANQESPFFGMMRFLTVCGFFGMSKYGGNREDIGWKLVGMDPNAHVYTSPFGFYDAEYLQENSNG
jgi:hypothetical protein